MFVLEVCILTFCEGLVRNVRFGSVDSLFWRKSRGKCSFWKCVFSLFAKVSWKTFVLEVWIHSFGESLVENARFGSVYSHFLQRSRGKRSFWKCGFTLLAKVSWKMFVLEVCILTFCEGLVKTVRFGSVDSLFWRKSRGKCSFWKCVFSLLRRSREKRSFWKCGFTLLAKVSWKMLVLEVCILTFCKGLVENVRFGSVDSLFWRKSRGKVWKMFVLEVWILTFGKVSWKSVENVRFGSVDSHFWQSLVEKCGKCSFWKCGFSLFAKVSWKTLVLEVLILRTRKRERVLVVDFGCCRVRAHEFARARIYVPLCCCAFGICDFKFHLFWLAVLLVSWERVRVIFFLAPWAMGVCKGIDVTVTLRWWFDVCFVSPRSFAPYGHTRCSLTSVHLSSTGLPSTPLPRASITSYTFTSQVLMIQIYTLRLYMFVSCKATLPCEALHVWHLPTPDIFSLTFSHFRIISHHHIWHFLLTSCACHIVSHLDIFSHPHTFTPLDIWNTPHIFSHRIIPESLLPWTQILSPAVTSPHLHMFTYFSQIQSLLLHKPP